MHTRPYHQGLSSSCTQRAWGPGSDELPFFVRSFAANSYICSFLNLALSTLDEIDEEKTSLSVLENRME